MSLNTGNDSQGIGCLAFLASGTRPCCKNFICHVVVMGPVEFHSVLPRKHHVARRLVIPVHHSRPLHIASRITICDTTCRTQVVNSWIDSDRYGWNAGTFVSVCVSLRLALQRLEERGSPAASGRQDRIDLPRMGTCVRTLPPLRIWRPSAARLSTLLISIYPKAMLAISRSM